MTCRALAITLGALITQHMRTGDRNEVRATSRTHFHFWASGLNVHTLGLSDDKDFVMSWVQNIAWCSSPEGAGSRELLTPLTTLCRAFDHLLGLGCAWRDGRSAEAALPVIGQRKNGTPTDAELALALSCHHPEQI